jgi:hypothetical protein
MAFAMLLLYLLIIYIRPGEWIPALSRWQIVDLATVGSLFFMVAEMAIGRRPFTKAPHNGMLLGLFVSLLLSHAANTYVGGMVVAFRFFLVNLVVYLLIANTVTTVRRVQITLWLLIWLSVTLAIQGIQQAEAGVGWAGQSMSMDGRITWIGIFEDPNDLALAFVIVAPLLLGAVFSRGFLLFTLAPLALLAALVYGVYLTN